MIIPGCACTSASRRATGRLLRHRVVVGLPDVATFAGPVLDDFNKEGPGELCVPLARAAPPVSLGDSLVHGRKGLHLSLCRELLQGCPEFLQEDLKARGKATSCARIE